MLRKNGPGGMAMRKDAGAKFGLHQRSLAHGHTDSSSRCQVHDPLTHPNSWSGKTVSRMMSRRSSWFLLLQARAMCEHKNMCKQRGRANFRKSRPPRWSDTKHITPNSYSKGLGSNTAAKCIQAPENSLKISRSKETQAF